MDLGGVEMKDFFSPKEVSKLLKVSEKTVRRYLRDGVLKGQKLNGNWEISEEVVLNHMNQVEDDVHFNSIEQSLIFSVKIENVQIGHQIAKSIINMMGHKAYDECKFSYMIEKSEATFEINGSPAYLMDVLKLIDQL